MVTAEATATSPVLSSPPLAAAVQPPATPPQRGQHGDALPASLPPSYSSTPADSVGSSGATGSPASPPLRGGSKLQKGCIRGAPGVAPQTAHAPAEDNVAQSILKRIVDAGGVQQLWEQLGDQGVRLVANCQGL